MSPAPRRRTLVVANRTASTERLLDEIQRRAAVHPTDFVLLVPSGHRRDWTLDEALDAPRRAGTVDCEVDSAAARGPARDQIGPMTCVRPSGSITRIT